MSDHQLTEEEYKAQVAGVWKVTVILSIVRVVEVAAGLILGPHLPLWIMNAFYAIASIAKAFFIIGEFMHLKYEKRVFMLSLGLPLFFLLWAIIAFGVEGNYLHKLLYLIK